VNGGAILGNMMSAISFDFKAEMLYFSDLIAIDKKEML